MATRKNTSAAVANMVATATSKAAALVAKAEQSAAERIAADIEARLHEAAEIQRAGEKKADGLRATAYNMAIDAARAAGLDAGETVDLLKASTAKAVDAGDLSAATGKAYINGLTFAIMRHVPWTSNLHGTEAKVQALIDAGKKIPADLKKAAEKLAEKTAQRDAKQSEKQSASLESVVKYLAKALADTRTIGRDTLALDILDCIYSIKPDFTEKVAE